MVGALIVSGCQGDGTSNGADRSRLEQQVAVARTYRGFPLYSAGMKVGNLPLTAVDRGAEHFGESVTFIYGTCEGSGDEPSCSPPLQIQVTSLCNRLPKDLGIHRVSPTRLRGAVTGAAEAGADNGGDLSIYVRGATITIYGGSHGLDLRAVRALRGANRLARGVKAGEPLPAASRQEIAGAGC